MLARTFFLAVIAFLAALAMAAPAGAEEKITNFASAIDIGSDGSMHVDEKITVIAQGDLIRHGIYRDFPTVYRSASGTVYRIGFKVDEVLLDGTDVPYAISPLANGKRIKIGNANTLVPPGEHVYEIAYDVTGEIGFYKDYDELYWNVNGTGSDFATDRVSALVTLPANARILDYTAYTGAQGSRAKNFRAQRLNDDRIEFETTSPLGPHENLTIVVTWPKGIVAAPAAAERTLRFFWQNASLFISGLGLALIFIYYVVAWLRVGRDPPAGTIVPLFHPPQTLSPPAVRFIRRMGYDRKAFTAALVDMAVKGALKIVDDGHKFTLIQTGKGDGLSHGEADIEAALFAADSSIPMDNKYYAAFGKAVNRLREALEGDYRKAAFVRNQGYFWISMAMTIAVAGATALVSPSPGLVAGLAFFTALWAAFGAFIILRVWARVLSGANSFGHRVGGIVQAVVSLLVVIPIALGLIGVASQLSQFVNLWTAAFLCGSALLNIVFFELMKAPTLAGRKLMDEIEGFRMYLGTAEQHRLDVLTPPEETPALFEKYLPYAIALDVENQWNERFQAVFAQAAQAPGTPGGYNPAWYSGPSLNRIAAGGFAGALGGALAAAAASAATAPGSSSGMGGGSSGGGGGGGGVGGW